MCEIRRFVFSAVLLLVCLVAAVGCGRSGGIAPSTTPPHTSISRLSETVDGYAAQNLLSPDQAKGLIASLESARAELNHGNAKMAREHLDIFKRDVQALIEKGMLLDPQGQVLVTQVTGIQADLDALAHAKKHAKPLPPGITGCAEQVACQHTTFYVDIRTKLLGSADRERLDGSVERPFPSIAAALEQAETLALCGVEIRIAAGVYEGDLNLSRGTRLLGDGKDAVTITGSILNYGGFELDVRDLTIQDSGRHGAIFIDMPCAVVKVIGVRIAGAETFGIYQRGGVLTVDDTEIRETRATEDTIYAGTGVYLDGGVQAAFSSTRIQDNESAGLVLQGSDTRLYGIQVTVEDNRLNPYFKDQVSAGAYLGYAAVEARHGALLLMEFCTIQGNEWIGLSVHDGARAHFRYGGISSTHFPEGMSDGNAFNFFALDSTAQITNFTIDHADLAGLVVQNAYLTLSDGEVSYSPVGIAIRAYDDPEYDPLRCVNTRIDWRENGFTLDSAYQPVPAPPGDDATPKGSDACPEVPFVCDWCGEGD